MDFSISGSAVVVVVVVVMVAVVVSSVVVVVVACVVAVDVVNVSNQICNANLYLSNSIP